MPKDNRKFAEGEKSRIFFAPSGIHGGKRGEIAFTVLLNFTQNLLSVKPMLLIAKVLVLSSV
jgi:hypothetical protein